MCVKPCEGNLCPLDLPSLPAAAEHWSEFLSAGLPPPGDPAGHSWAQMVPVSQAQLLLKQQRMASYTALILRAISMQVNIN